MSEPVSIPEEGVERAISVLRGGRLFRYGEFRGGSSEVASLEREFAAYMGHKYAVAMNSCGSTLFIALKCAGVEAGDQVLVNAFTLAPVPGAIAHAGAQAVFLQCKDDFTVDLEDFERQASRGARVFLLSHMRGHIADMDAITAICDAHGITLIEDCAHTLGARWDGRLSGSFGSLSCFSLQTFKHINAGEGGLLVTDDEDAAARAILYSGSYMLYGQNGTPPPEDAFERHKYTTPNFSLRMGELTAAIARPQIPLLRERVDRWRDRYDLLEHLLAQIPGLRVPARDAREAFAPSSIQFSLTGLTTEQSESVLAYCKDHGVDIKWFGRAAPQGFTSTWRDWRYHPPLRELTETDNVLAALCDMRIPLSLSNQDCHTIAGVVAEAVHRALFNKPPGSGQSTSTEDET